MNEVQIKSKELYEECAAFEADYEKIKSLLEGGAQVGWNEYEDSNLKNNALINFCIMQPVQNTATNKNSNLNSHISNPILTLLLSHATKTDIHYENSLKVSPLLSAICLANTSMLGDLLDHGATFVNSKTNVTYDTMLDCQKILLESIKANKEKNLLAQSIDTPKDYHNKSIKI